MDKGRWEGILGICVFSKLCLFLMALSSSQLDGSVLRGTGKNWGSTGKDWESLGQHWAEWDLPWEALDQHWEELGSTGNHWEITQHREITGNTKQHTYKGCALDMKLTWI